MKGIFVSYRRSTFGSHAAARICERLNDRYGEELVFFDIQDIKAGRNFVERIDEELALCYAMVVVIDEYWTSAEQLHRLNDPNDFVRREIAMALGREVVVLPLLLEGAEIPSENSLPDSLWSLCKCQAIQLRHTSFDRDIEYLLEELNEHYSELEALSNSMPCPHCQQAIRLAPGNRFATCQSCERQVGVVRVVLPGNNKNNKNLELSRQLELAALDIASERYHDAYKQYNRILETSPNCWEALNNMAVCLFWIGYEDLEHLPEVFGLLQKAEVLSNNHPKVCATRRGLSYNLAAMANEEDMIGDRISWSLDVFEFCRQLEDDSAETLQLEADYFERCFSGIRHRLVELLTRDGKSFDPPLSEISTMVRLMRFADSDRLLSFFILMVKRKLEVSSNTYKLVEELAVAEERVKRINPEEKPLEISFPLFGKPRIVEI